MKQRLILASASVLALAAAIVPGCADHIASTTDPLTPGAGGSASTPGGAGAGNQVAAAGTGGAAPGVSGAAAGAGGSEGNPPVTAPGSAGTSGANLGGAQGGSGGAAGAAGGAGAPGAAGAGGAPSPSAFCAGSPSNGGMCTVTCTDQCGVHNLGTRLCTCTNAVYACVTCVFAMPHPLITPPTTPLTACEFPDDAQEDDETGCADNERCQSIGRMTGATDGANRFCGCLMNRWDCDTKPAGF